MDILKEEVWQALNNKAIDLQNPALNSAISKRNLETVRTILSVLGHPEILTKAIEENNRWGYPESQNFIG